jgi:hypothetical protein
MKLRHSTLRVASWIHHNVFMSGWPAICSDEHGSDLLHCGAVVASWLTHSIGAETHGHLGHFCMVSCGSPFNF